MKIANPIYDVVFKYLMEDPETAKAILSLIIGEEIEVLEFVATEQVHPLESSTLSFTVFRMDFAATVVGVSGVRRKVLIELQKAKFVTDIMRFRRYLGKEYSKKSNVYTEPTEDGGTRTKALPLVTIYFLGFPLEQATAPVIKVERNYVDLETGKEIKEKEEFIESLTHDSYVIQIPHLNRKQKSELLRLLGIFDQSYKMENEHFLQLEEHALQQKYGFIYQRLQTAAGENYMETAMEIEDEVLKTLAEQQRQTEERLEKKFEKKLAQERSEKEKERAEKEAAQQAKAHERAEKEAAQQAEAHERAEKEKVLKEIAKERAEKEELLKKIALLSSVTGEKRP